MPLDQQGVINDHFGNPDERAYAVLDPAKWDDFLGGGNWLE